MIRHLKDFCRLFYTTTLIPTVFLCQDTKEIFHYPSTMDFMDFSWQTYEPFIHPKKNPDYFTTTSFGYVGIIRIESTNDLMIIGPVFSTQITDDDIKDFFREWNIPKELRHATSEFLKNAPQISFYRFMHTLEYLSLSLNDRIIETRQHFSNISPQRPDISKDHSDQMFESKENKAFHNTYSFELHLLKFVQDGDVDGLRKFFNSIETDLQVGNVASNSLRQEKNIFITTIALTTRSAIAGGLDIEQAYSLSDVYLRECERMPDIPSVAGLSETAVFDFTERVAKSKIIGGLSTEVFECVQFINKNTHEPIRVDDVAAHIKKSRSYITRKFKSELGFDISSFIMRCKLEEAKSLLTFSNKSLSEISSSLCFSSQGYFQNVFKKKYGITPLAYRKKTQR